MTSTDDPQAGADAPRREDGGPPGLTMQTHAEALAGTRLRGALFAQWGREKRRTALRQRYGEEAGVLSDEGETAFEYRLED